MQGKSSSNSCYLLPGSLAGDRAPTQHSFFQAKKLFSLRKYTPSRREEGGRSSGWRAPVHLHSSVELCQLNSHRKPVWVMMDPAGASGKGMGGRGGSAQCRVVVGVQTCMEWFAVLVCSEVLPVLKQIILVFKMLAQGRALYLHITVAFFPLSLCKWPALETMQKKSSTLGKYPQQTCTAGGPEILLLQC